MKLMEMVGFFRKDNPPLSHQKVMDGVNQENKDIEDVQVYGEGVYLTAEDDQTIIAAGFLLCPAVVLEVGGKTKLLHVTPDEIFHLKNDKPLETYTHIDASEVIKDIRAADRIDVVLSTTAWSKHRCLEIIRIERALRSMSKVDLKVKRTSYLQFALVFKDKQTSVWGADIDGYKFLNNIGKR